MKSCYYYCILICALFFCNPKLYSQGCSDAGFCTMGAMKPDQRFDNSLPIKLRSVGFTFYEGQSNTSVLIRSGILDLGFITKNNLNLQLKLPYTVVKGNFGTNQGLGDLSLSLTKNLTKLKTFEVLGTIGAKIPTGKANDRHQVEGVVLPMYYQTSLGTFDFVMGASLINRDWLFSAGYQQPLMSQNENSFVADPQAWDWYEGEIEYVKKYDEGVHIKRGADIMSRVERNWRLSRLNFNIGLLSIYRITKDQGRDENGEFQKLAGTKGLALTALFGMGYQFNVYSGVSIMYGQRLSDRTYNPDGLTRKHVLNFTYNCNF
jgi:hypothetical protein